MVLRNSDIRWGIKWKEKKEVTVNGLNGRIMACGGGKRSTAEERELD